VSAGEDSHGLLDTSVLVDLAALAADPQSALPDRADISTIALAELSAGPLLTDDADERARRLHVLQRAQAEFDPLPFDDRCAAAYPRGLQPPVPPLFLIAAESRIFSSTATALAYELPLYAAVALSRDVAWTAVCERRSLTAEQALGSTRLARSDANSSPRQRSSDEFSSPASSVW
jgi:tRNA(fMet)-specific endonuclease VapC